MFAKMYHLNIKFKRWLGEMHSLPSNRKKKKIKRQDQENAKWHRFPRPQRQFGIFFFCPSVSNFSHNIGYLCQHHIIFKALL